MNKDSEVIDWLRKNGSEELVAGMSGYGIPSTKAIGVPMGAMKAFAKNAGQSAIGKRNLVLNKAAVNTATHIAQSENKAGAWIGSHALRELNSDKVQARLKLQKLKPAS